MILGNEWTPAITRIRFADEQSRIYIVMNYSKLFHLFLFPLSLTLVCSFYSKDENYAPTVELLLKTELLLL